LALSTLVLLTPTPTLPADAPQGCVPVARIVSIQGSVQIQRSGQSAWSVVRKLDTVVCQGDVLHAGPRSRAALLIDPETLVRLDQSSTLSIRQTPDETIVEFTKDPGLFQRAVTAPNPCGAGYFISRFPRKFRVLTPFVNASVEGTEFLVAMRCESALVAVFEGRVRAEEVLAAASFSLKEGESVEAGVGQPAAMKLVVKPVDAVQWALYYPPLTEAAGEAAADQKCDQADNAARSVCLVQRAEQRLRSGRVEEAEADVQTLLTLGLGDGDAYALLSTIQVVKNDKAAALDLANRATQLSPNSPRAWIALSYANQASFELEKALAAANKAAGLAPGSATAQARVAELLMSLGRIREAEKAAKAAVAANPDDSRAHMVLGFVHLAQINTKAAREDFLNAIERDSTEPLSRLGLGLAIIRDGDLKAGREQIEIAVALDPTNSLLRSYGGKAYYEENTKERDRLAATQFGIAKRLDPNDPTAWFYDAILRQTQNRPVEALQDLQRSTDLNDSRAVYRSKLLLDEDRAAKSARRALVFDELGFDRAALDEAAKSVTTDPSNHAGHRFLADVLARQDRQEITRVSELLQSQVLQPVVAAPIQPHSMFRDIALIGNAGPTRASAGEYWALFERDRVRAQISGLGGDLDTWGEEALVSGLAGRFSFSLGQFHYQTDGFRPNNDVTHDIYTVFGQLAATPSLDVQLEFRSRDSEMGDLTFNGDPDVFDPSSRHFIEQEISRLGARYKVAAGHDVLLSFIHAYRREELLSPDFFGLGEHRSIGENDSNQLEGQYIHRAVWGSVVVGAGGYEYSNTTRDIFAGGVCFLPVCELDSTERMQNAYGILNWNFRKNSQLIAGFSYDAIEEGKFDFSRINPKLGWIHTFSPSLSLRVAAFSSVKPALVADQTLQPVQIAGFSQFFDDTNATISRRVGLAVDAHPVTPLYLGIEFSARDADFALSHNFDPFFIDLRERTVTPYLDLSITNRTSVSVKYGYAETEIPEDQAITGSVPSDLKTEILPVTLRAHLTNGIFGELRGTYVRQRIENTVPVLGQIEEHDFTLVDLGLGYRFPRRYGTISFEVRNVTDERFSFNDTAYISSQPLNLKIVPERTFLARISLYF
jgi:tetratricopeptide (TPR) repeat protein